VAEPKQSDIVHRFPPPVFRRSLTSIPEEQSRLS
jgi:hypothetical protein